MATKTMRFFLYALLLVCTGGHFFAQSITVENLRAHLLQTFRSANYSFIINEDKEVVFTQHWTWIGDPSIMRYKAVFTNEAGTEFAYETTEPHVNTELSSGTYILRITSYDFFDEPSSVTADQTIVIERAAIPEITAISPNQVYIEQMYDDDFLQVTVNGQNLPESLLVFLVNSTNDRTLPLSGTVVSRSDRQLRVRFDSNSLFRGSGGIYRVILLEKSGLWDERELRISNNKPVDWLLSAGYSPTFIVPTAILPDLFQLNTLFIPASVKVDFWAFFIKKGWGSLALGASLEYANSDIFISSNKTSISNVQLISALAGIAYRFRFNRHLFFLAQIQAGINYNIIQIRHTTQPEVFYYYMMPMTIKGGVNLQYFPFKKQRIRNLFFTIGAEGEWTLYDNFTAEPSIKIKPSLSIGWEF